KDVIKEIQEERELSPPDEFAVNPGEKVVAIEGNPIDPNDKQQVWSYWKLDQAVQNSNGRPVTVTVSDSNTRRDIQVIPRFAKPFKGVVNFAGLVPRAMIDGISAESNARGKLKPGDI